MEAFSLLLTVAVACAPTLAEQEGRARANPNRITQEEIQASTASNAFELIQSLAAPAGCAREASTVPIPRRWRGGDQGLSQPGPHGGPAELRNIPVGGITSLEFIDTRTAIARWGTGYTFGAIVVSTQPRDR